MTQNRDKIATAAGLLPTGVGCLLLLISLAAGAADVERGKEKSATCAACHGVDGNSVNPEWPRLAGQHASYTAKQLRNYRSGERQNAQMSVLAAGLSDEDIADLAAYYASQQTASQGAEAALVELGELIYRAGNAATGVPACIGCHGPRGIGNPLAIYPSLSHQHARYTAAQLRAWQQGERSNDPNAIMSTIAKALSSEEIDAVSEYTAGLH